MVKMRIRRITLSVLLIKPTKGKKVPSEICNKIKLETSGAELSSIRKIKAGGILAELVPRTANKSTFYEAIETLLNTLIPSLQLT